MGSDLTNKVYHDTIVEIAFKHIPASYQQRFTVGFPFELFLEYSHVPYVSDRVSELPFEHVDHCYKLHLKGRDLYHVGDGDVLAEIVKLGKAMPELALAGEDELVRMNIAKGTHYIIDIATFPHAVFEGWNKYHVKFENFAATWLEANKDVIARLTENYVLDPFRSIQNRARAIAEDTYTSSLEYLPTLKRNAVISDRLMANMACKHVEYVMNWLATFEKCL